ncbi:MAG: glycosyltransferase family 4 protein [Chloroflexi bacterium]|nr:glycosyltransferase family 4 protein [Chloroflexota bacterium]
MHIALNGWFWDQPWVGSGQYLHNLLAHLSALDADIALTLVLPDHVRAPEGVPANVNVAHGKTRFGGNLGKVWFEQRGYPAAVQQLGADIAHVPYWGTPLSTKPARLVVSVLDLIPLVLPEYRGGFRAKLYTSLVAAGAGGAAHIITLSEASKRDIVAQLDIPAERVTVTYLGFDDRYHPKLGQDHDEAIREKYGLPDEYALYLGSFDIRKNVHNLLLAWTYAGPTLGEQIPLVLAGRQPTAWKRPLFPNLHEYARQLDVERYLIWLNGVDEADKPALYRMASVFIFPSRYEGFGLPVLEAMASGTPVVAGNLSSIPEIVEDAAYLVDPNDARTLGAAILAVIVQEDLQNHLANAGRGQATRFSWRKTAQQTLDVYRQVMEE